MRSNRLWLVALTVVCCGTVGLAQASAGKKKAKTEAVTLRISNLTAETTPKLVKKLERTVKKVKGVTKISVSKKKGELTVRHTPEATADAIKGAVAKAGFEVVEPSEEPDDGPAGDEDFE